MKKKVNTLKELICKFEHEIKLIAHNLSKTQLSPLSKETMMENLATLNMVMDTAKDSVESSLVCCRDENLNLSVMETGYIMRALERNKGHIGKSAWCVGLSPRTMNRRIQDLKIDVSVYKEKKRVSKDTVAHLNTKNKLGTVLDHR